VKGLSTTLFFFSFAVFAAKAQDGVLTGRVTDWVTNTGIADATLEAQDARGHKLSTLTKADGTYKLDKLPRAVPLRVSCSQLGYTPNPKTGDLTIRTGKAEWSAKLFQEKAGDAYWKQAAKKLALRYGTEDEIWFASNANAEARKAVSKELEKLAPDDASAWRVLAQIEAHDNGRVFAQSQRPGSLAGAAGTRPSGSSAGVTHRNRSEGTALAFSKDGRLSDIQANGLWIHYGAGGTRRVDAARPDGSRIVAESGGRGYVEHPYSKGYVARTYYGGGKAYSQLYRSYAYRGTQLDQYVPSVYYNPGYYGWVEHPWSSPVVYEWRASGLPWLNLFGPYAYADPVYPSGSSWVTDFVLAKTLTNSPGSGEAAQAQEDKPSSWLNGELKAQISQEVRNQIASEGVQSESPGHAQEADPSANGISGILSDGRKHVLVAGGTLSAVVHGGECDITAGDVLELDGKPPQDPMSVPLRVLASKGKDCPVGNVVQLSLRDVQEMENHLRSAIDEGLAELQKQSGQNGLPAVPPGSDTAIKPTYSAIAPPPDPAGAKEIEQVREAAKRVEKEVRATKIE